MQSHARQACRPLRRVSSSLHLQCLGAANALSSKSFAASISTAQPPFVAKPYIAKAAYTGNKAKISSSSAAQPAKAAPAKAPAAGKTSGSSKLKKHGNTGVNSSTSLDPLPIDPQAAVPPAATIADLDPALSAQIPTFESAKAPATTRSPAKEDFKTALSSGSGVSIAEDIGTNNGAHIDWSSSFHGLSATPFGPEAAEILMRKLDADDIEMKPDGILYLPEIKYRRILNKAFGPGGWGLAPRGELTVGDKVVTREFALIAQGRYVSQARGECQYFSDETIPTAGEGAKSNALLRCCKDLGIASELWDPRFIRKFKKEHCHEVWVEHVVSKKRRRVWTRKDTDPAYPYQVAKAGPS
ncbi:mitochondrial genome maintenance MGM101-domain-containing protein [Podospora didyma]|uniref:Mitochondrial genome maintenance protein MGM101 n=1 Tax=Podospora didyma TaxID=330526 RepID=A0AAE0TW32_9PEZI|nr:mitochondrial genome maintenance MGM101-domain-containing protein [Podospora didyma]